MPASETDPAESPEGSQTQVEQQQQRQDQTDAASSSKSQPQSQIAPFSQTTKRAATLPSISAHSSPKSSRDTSPIRPSPLKLAQNAPRLSRSRKNSQDLSPHRTGNSSGPAIPETPSAAAIQRALSATPRLNSTTTNGETSTDPQRPQRANRSGVGANQNSANTSSRVKSPPTAIQTNKPNPASARKNEQEPQPATTPRIVVDDGASKSSANFDSIAEEEDDEDMASGTMSPARNRSIANALEAVQESSLPETPAISGGGPLQNGKARSGRSSVAEPTGAKEASSKTAQAPTESGSESGGNRSTSGVRKQQKKPQSVAPNVKPPPIKANNSFTQLPGTKNKGASSVGNMSVETETVTSIANAGIGGPGPRESSSKADTGSTVRLKPSSETIRPKKDKKKVARKAPSIHGTASSKADIFEAKVASAVDEANSSDSEETFVYESNPPEPHSRPSRYHSRTPSAASTASQADHFAGRYRSDGHNSIVGKKSMKFANSSNHFNNIHGDSENGSAAGTIGSGRGSGTNNSHHHHHHIGRHGRNTGHTSLFDSDSPFTNANNKIVQTTKHAKVSSRPNSPRSPYTPRASGSSKTHKPSYALEDDVADDERTPLITSARNRNRHSRRPTRHETYTTFRPPGVFKGFFGYALMGLLIAILAVTVILALVLCSKTLTGVRLRDIKNVIASEEEIVFDMHVHATNPNIVAVQVVNADIKIFAKSKYVGSSKVEDGKHTLRSRRATQASRLLENGTAGSHTSGGIDEGTDPIEEPIGGDTMLLGHVYHLDSPLNFEPSPARHHVVSDVGEVSLANPGNRTADEGSDRWKTVVQHTFELIVVGQLNYSLPISSKVHLVSMGQAKTSVDPDSPVIHKTVDIFHKRTVEPSSTNTIRLGRRTIAFKS